LSRYRNKPQYFQSPKPERKYESMTNPERLSSPLVERPLKYTLETNGNVWVDTEQVAREVERRMEGKLTEQFFEKFRGELEELLSEAKETREDSSKPAESEIEPVQEVERVERHQEQKGDFETDRIENDGGSPEVDESKKDEVSLEGDFVFSQPFEVAIPIEADEAELERVMQGSESEEKAVDESKPETKENESAEKLEEEDVEEEPEEVETETEDESTESEESETTEKENPEFEDVEAEESPDVSSEVATEEAIQTEDVISEPLLEEAELYPVETESQDAEII
jgi:hypothetical protein